MKIPDVELRGAKDPGLLDFMDYVQLILNTGRYEFRVVTAEPTWSANEGEAVFYSSGTDRRLYVYINGEWKYIGWGSASGITAAKIQDADEDTKVDVEESADEDKIRMDTGGTELAQLDHANITTSFIEFNAHRDADADTGFEVERGADDDILRMKSGGTDIANADANQLAVASDKKLGLEGYAGNTYFKYNSTSEYMEFYIDGNKRADF